MGSPDFIRENLRACEDANLDTISFIVQCGDRKHEEIMDSLQLFAKEVMPEFQERHETKHRKWREEQLAGVDLLNNSTI